MNRGQCIVTPRKISVCNSPNVACMPASLPIQCCGMDLNAASVLVVSISSHGLLLSCCVSRALLLFLERNQHAVSSAHATLAWEAHEGVYRQRTHDTAATRTRISAGQLRLSDVDAEYELVDMAPTAVCAARRGACSGCIVYRVQFRSLCM